MAAFIDNPGLPFCTYRQRLQLLNGAALSPHRLSSNESLCVSSMMIDSGHKPTTVYSSSVIDEQQQQLYLMKLHQEQHHMEELQLHFQQRQLHDHHLQQQQQLQQQHHHHSHTQEIHQRQQTEEQPQPQAKRVSFNPSVDVVEVKHLNDFHSEEKDQVWLSKKEYLRIKAEIYFYLRKNDDDVFDTVSFTFRGLETKTLQEQRRNNQREARQAVLNEQLFQRTEKSHLPEVIAMLYNVLSFPCQQQAFEAGVEDAKAVYNCCDGTSESNDSSELRSTPLMLCESMPMDSEFVYAGDSIVERLAQEEASINGGRTSAVPSVEDWLVDRFQKGELLAQRVGRSRLLDTTAAVAIVPSAIRI